MYCIIILVYKFETYSEFVRLPVAAAHLYSVQPQLTLMDVRALLPVVLVLVDSQKY